MPAPTAPIQSLNAPVGTNAPVGANALVGAGEVHLWHGDLDQIFARTPHLEIVLSEAERGRAFARPRDRARFVAARGVLREILADCAGAQAARLEIETGVWGKPFLARRGEWRFNLAHSGSMAVWAVARGHEVGVDIERARPLAPALVARFASAREQRLIAGDTSHALPIWTRKEAYLKAVGRGLTVALPEIDVCNSQGQIALWDEASSRWRECGWRFCDVEWPGYVAAVAAVAARHQNWRVVPRELGAA